MEKAAFPIHTTEHPNDRAARLHVPKNTVQAATLQTGIVNLFVTFERDFHQTRELPLRHGIADTMTKLATTWRAIDEHRRDIQGKPRAGSLSPAERAAKRARKSAGKQRSGPTLAAQVPTVAKESLSQG